MATQTREEEKLFFGKECGAKGSNLKIHMATHTREEKEKNCKECGAVFPPNTSIHNEEKPFSCKECGAGFA